MKIYNFFIFILISERFCKEILQPIAESLSKLQAFNEVVDEFFIKNSIKFDVTIIKQNPSLKNGQQNDKFLAELKDQNSYQLSSWEPNPNQKLAFFNPNLIFVDSCLDFG